VEHVRGRILKGDEVILDGLYITLNVREPRGRLKQWGGSLRMDPADHIEPGGPYRLELEDGRAGDITVVKVDYSLVSKSYRVLFTAAGSLI
jgi:hypothetical protein